MLSNTPEAAIGHIIQLWFNLMACDKLISASLFFASSIYSVFTRHHTFGWVENSAHHLEFYTSIQSRVIKVIVNLVAVH